MASNNAAVATPSRSTQAASAEAMYSCLVDANLPAVLENTGPEVAVVTWDIDRIGYAILIEPDADSRQTFGDAIAPDSPDDFVSSEALPYRLMIDDVDHSAAYSRCQVLTGYATSDREAPDYAYELRQKQASIEANNQWAACARENGLPNLADSDPPVADGWATSPVLLLPAAISVDFLRTVLEACPNFDENRLRADPFAYSDSSSPGYLPDPIIAVAIDWDTATYDEQIQADNIYQVLYEQFNEVSGSVGYPRDSGVTHAP